MNLLTETIFRQDKKIYFVLRDINIIGYIDLNTREIELLGCIPEEKIFADRLCSKILVRNEEIIFVPMNAKKIWIYNIKTKEWQGIKLGKYESRKNKILQAVIYQNNLFMFGCSCPAIFQLDLTSKQLIAIEQPFMSLNSKREHLEDILFKRQYVQIKSEIFMASCLDNTIMKFNMCDKSVFFYEVGSKENRYSGIVWDGKYFWISPLYMTSLVRWDGENEVIEYELPGVLKEEAFYGIIKLDFGYLLSGKKKYSIAIVNEKEKIAMKILKKAYIFIEKEKGCIYSLDVNGSFILYENGNKKEYKFDIEKQKLWFFIKNKIKECKINIEKMEKESGIFNLEAYINVVSVCEVGDISRRKNVGNNMWNLIKEKI